MMNENLDRSVSVLTLKFDVYLYTLYDRDSSAYCIHSIAIALSIDPISVLYHMLYNIRRCDFSYAWHKFMLDHNVYGLMTICVNQYFKLVVNFCHL